MCVCVCLSLQHATHTGVLSLPVLLECRWSPCSLQLAAVQTRRAVGLFIPPDPALLIYRDFYADGDFSF